MPHSMWDLHCPTRNRTHTPALSLNCWTTREVPQWILCALLGVVLQDGTRNVT